MKLLTLISTIFQPAADLIDNLHTSEDERLDQKRRLVEVQAALLDSALEYEKESLKAQASIVEAEAMSKHWITATWRPIVMLTFCGLVVLDSLGVVQWATGARLAEEMWLLLQVGLGGYVVGRSAEKVTEAIMNKKAG